MKKGTFLLAFLAQIAMSAQTSAAQETIVLDLSKARTQLTFDEKTGAWTGTYDDDETSIDSLGYC